MKKSKQSYFLEEIQKLFIGYAMIPAAVVAVLGLGICFAAMFYIRRRNVNVDDGMLILFCCIVMLFCLVILAGWVLVRSGRDARKKMEDFYTILEVMEKGREGDLDSLIQIDSENEFRGIADAYNDMIISLKKQMLKNQKMAELVASAQMKQLESQFNPHFLFNTLENIRYMYKIDPEKAEQMVLSLSRLLRYSLDNGAGLVPLEKDMIYLENYLTILKCRFNRRLSCQIDITEEAKGCLIPRLIFQPLIENAVKHGLGNRARLQVELKAYCHEGKLMIICRDDGEGMSAGMLTEVTASLQEEENCSSHSGLYNIHRRIYLLYGAPYGVEIRSQEGYGTTLIVTSPVCREESTC